MDQSQIWNEIVNYNEQYRKGNPTISDQQFDDIVENYITKFGLNEIEVRSKLMDQPGKVKHDQMCGSLKKTKAEDDSFDKWWSKQQDTTLVASEKIDGMSIVVKFKDGKFVSATTRGDGEFGENQTEKCRHIVPNSNNNFTGTVRGELTLINSTFEKLKQLDPSREHKNLRNSTVGIIGHKTTHPELCQLVQFIAYEIVGTDATRYEQLIQLKQMGFQTPKFELLHGTIERQQLVQLYSALCDRSPYMIDGLVIHGHGWVAENDKYYPDNARAFKVNNCNAKSQVINVEWNLGKTGKLTPVINIEPVELIGTTVARATAHNAKYVFDQGIVAGSIVTIQKSGDIIPCIINVEGSGVVDIDKIACPCCEHEAAWDANRTHLICDNDECEGKTIKNIESFIIKLGIEGITSKSLINFGIESFEDLLSFQADPKYKKQVQLQQDIEQIIMSTHVNKLYENLTWKGAGRKTINKVVEHIGMSKFYSLMNETVSPQDVDLPPGIGIITIENLISSFEQNELIVNKITSDPRYNPVETVVEEVEPSSDTLSGQSFCITGKTTTPRKQLQQTVKDNGGRIASVSGKLDYLVCGASGVGPSKIEKAKKLNINVITEDQFLEMVQ